MTIIDRIKQESQIQSSGLFYVVMAMMLIIAGLLVYIGFFSYQTRVATLRRNQAHEESIQGLRSDIKELQNRLAGLDDSSGRTQGESLSLIDQNKMQSSVSTPEHDSEESSVKQDKELNQLKQVVESTGLEELSKKGDLNPQVLQDVYDETAKRKEITAYRARLLDWNAGQLKIDKEQYGEELDQLYQQARLYRGTAMNAEERDAAFNELLDKYPDSYAAARLISDRAIAAALRKRDVQETEKYYDMLMANDNDLFRNVVTGIGMEAVPAIEHNLAWMYTREGQFDKAESMLKSLEINHSQSLVIIRSPLSGPQWVPVQEAIDRIRQNMDSRK